MFTSPQRPPTLFFIFFFFFGLTKATGQSCPFKPLLRKSSCVACSEVLIDDQSDQYPFHESISEQNPHPEEGTLCSYSPHGEGWQCPPVGLPAPNRVHTFVHWTDYSLGQVKLKTKSLEMEDRHSRSALSLSALRSAPNCLVCFSVKGTHECGVRSTFIP